MENIETLYARLFRPAALLLGVVIYVAFTWVLWQDGFLQATEGGYLQLIAVWGIGLAVLLILPQRLPTFSPHSTVLLRALWCNLGVVGTAVLVAHSARVLLLVIPIFGVFYTALHLTRPYVLFIAGITWFFYLACTLLLASFDVVDTEFELLVAVAFSIMLCGSLLLAWEALRRQDELTEKTNELAAAVTRVQELAMQDELTGVHNRRYLMSVLERQKSLADRSQQSFTLCYCDLDYFKRLNDEYGHAVGDAALRKFAQLAKGMVRNVDYVARFGGEEFVLVLVEADKRKALQVASRLVAATRLMTIPGTPEELSISVSVGVTAYRSPEGLDAVLQRADRALYEAKDAGRDRVMLA